MLCLTVTNLIYYLKYETKKLFYVIDKLSENINKNYHDISPRKLFLYFLCAVFFANLK